MTFNKEIKDKYVNCDLLYLVTVINCMEEHLGSFEEKQQFLVFLQRVRISSSKQKNNS